jgi:pimeloyl-ACP methyl ester carboxylesterase
MADIVLVPGGWRGGWTFSSIARDIRARGHEAWTPTLTGLGERVHLARGSVNLDTHIDDIANLLLYEQLTQVVLCGHSYAGMVITGVADRMPERIAKLVYVDAFVPDDGNSWWDLAGEQYQQFAIEHPSADGLGVAPPENRDSRCVPHPLGAFRQSIRLTGRWREVREKVFIYATGWSDTPFTSLYERLKNDATWRVVSLPTGHSVIREAPEDFLSILLA